MTIARSSDSRWLPDSGQVSELIRATEWSESSLGPIAGWPQSLRTTLSNALASGLPTIVLWGPTHLHLYNDAYSLLLADRHPLAFGRPSADCVPEVWSRMRSICERVETTGEPGMIEGERYVVPAPGGTATRVFTICCSLVRDEAGQVGGVLAVLIDTTDRGPAGRTDRQLPSQDASTTEHLRRMFEQAPALMYVAEGPDHRFVMTNRAYQQFTGGRQVVGRTAREVLPDFDGQGYVKLLDEVYRSGRPHVAAAARVRRRRSPDGPLEEAWVNFVYQPLTAPDGRVTGIFAMAIDVTDGHLAMQRLRESEERFRVAADSAPAFMWMSDEHGAITFANRHYRDFFGVDTDAMLGERWREVVHPDDVDAFHQAYLEAIADRQAIRLTVRVNHPTLGVRWLNCSGAPRYGTDGLFLGFVGVNIDVTETVVAETQLRENKRQLDAVLNNASVAIFVMDERQHCTYMNPAAEQLTGYTVDETLGRPLHDVVHHTRPDGRPYPLGECPIDRAFPENNHEQGEETFVHKDGSFYPVAFTASPIRDEAAKVVGTIIEVRNIRRERETLEALRDADRRKDEFLAMLAHELRNPLAPIRNAFALLDREPLTGRGRQAMAMSQRQLRQLTRLVDDLLEVSRVTRGIIELRPEPVTLQHVIRAAAEGLAASLDEHRQRLRFQLPDQPLRLTADPVRLAQIVENLLTNASKYSDPGSEIVLRVRHDGAEVVIEVQDSGIGIAAEHLPRLFDLFTQVDTAIDRSRGGLGIGLALVKRLAELHGGSVSAASEGPGKGATFRISLPYALPEQV